MYSARCRQLPSFLVSVLLALVVGFGVGAQSAWASDLEATSQPSAVGTLPVDASDNGPDAGALADSADIADASLLVNGAADKEKTADDGTNAASENGAPNNGSADAAVDNETSTDDDQGIVTDADGALPSDDDLINDGEGANEQSSDASTVQGDGAEQLTPEVPSASSSEGSSTIEDGRTDAGSSDASDEGDCDGPDNLQADDAADAQGSLEDGGLGDESSDDSAADSGVASSDLDDDASESAGTFDDGGDELSSCVGGEPIGDALAEEEADSIEETAETAGDEGTLADETAEGASDSVESADAPEQANDSKQADAKAGTSADQAKSAKPVAAKATPAETAKPAPKADSKSAASTQAAKKAEGATKASSSKVSAKSKDTKTAVAKTASSKKVLPSKNTILKARNYVIWALLNGYKKINLEKFKLKFSSSKDAGRFVLYIIDNALAYTGHSDNASSYTSSKEGKLIWVRAVNFNQLKKPSKALYSALDDMVSWARDYDSKAAQAKAMHDWLVKYCSYNYRALDMGKDAYYKRYGYTPYTAESALVFHKPVCEGYALAYAMGLNRIGIANEVVSGPDHSWNRVYIGGKWYNIDVTWDDTGGTTKYFMKSDKYFYNTQGHISYYTRKAISRPGKSTKYDNKKWTKYNKPAYHDYVWDFSFKKGSVRIGTNSSSRLGVNAEYDWGQIPFQDVTWSSSNKKVVTVTPDGTVVSAGKHGKAVITCNVNGTKHKCTVWVVGGKLGSKSLKKSLNARAFWYDGKKHVPTVVVKEKTSGGTVKLRNGTDYQITYQNAKGKKIAASKIKKRGTYYAIVKGKGLYSGTLKYKFQITNPTITYRAHVQNIGWQKAKKNGQTAGTTGRALQLEAAKIQFSGKHSTKGSVQYRTHIKNVGWEKKWRSNGKVSGTTGKNLQLEAIQIKLTGAMAKKYDVYYRVHAQNFGWMGWAKNGQKAGTAGYAYRLEALQIKLVKKGAKAPGTTKRKFVQRRR